jgi:Domain of unknown function (DUF4328)
MNPSPYPAPFSSAHVRANIVKILLIVGAVATGLSLVAESLSLVFPPLTDDQELSDNPMGLAIGLIIFLVAIVELVIYLATVVFFCVWLYRVSDNLRAFSPARGPNYSPAMAVGSFFIPFANLVIPYRAVKEVWQKSGPPGEALLSEPGPAASFPIWWTFWLLSSFAGNISLRMSFDEKIPESTATIVSIVASALSIVAAVFAYLVVTAIDKRQEETSRILNLGNFSGPLPPPPNLSMSEVI